jgi:uncharacterized protein (UPF0264 family)
MELVIPVMTLQDARAAVEAGARLISVKNLHEGSMGANLTYTIKTVRKKIPRRIRLGATVGNFPGYMTCTAAQAALGAAVSGAKDHVTVGLYKVPSYREAAKMVKAVGDTIKRFDKRIGVAVCSFADYKEIGSISPRETLDILVDSQADIAVIDVAQKGSKHLFDYMSIEELRTFVEGAHSHGLWTLFLGSLGKDDVSALLQTGVDIMGARSTVCREGKWYYEVEKEKVRELVKIIDEAEGKSWIERWWERRQKRKKRLRGKTCGPEHMIETSKSKG